ncbi:hypothetical protein SUGI_0335260 [Cryptomeria japonica]|nr:hypothetical protein SUGI_0335260 [Cryptomeria japonica]
MHIGWELGNGPTFKKGDFPLLPKPNTTKLLHLLNLMMGKKDKFLSTEPRASDGHPSLVEKYLLNFSTSVVFLGDLGNK